MKPWWTNSSGNGLTSQLLQYSTPVIKGQFEALLKGETLTLPVNGEIVFTDLGKDQSAIWSLMLATGYLKVVHTRAPGLHELLARGIPAEHILKYGIAFQGKKCIVRKE